MTTVPREIGGYEILAELASGGMGRVLLGKRTGAHGFEQLVAIKTLLDRHAQDSSLRRAFLDEAKLLARLTHPSIAQVSDFGEADGYLYLVMEYVAGVTLSELLGRLRTPLPPRVAAEFFAQVCRGLDAVHALTDPHGRRLDVVHRDISPQNILMTFEGTAKIIDFGIALTLERDRSVTQLGQVKGKPAYMAPEQWRNAPIDRRVDVFATGVVMHEALTRQRLFRAKSAYATGLAVCTRPIPPPSSLADVPLALDVVVGRALSRPVEERYATAGAMADDLDAVLRTLDGEPLSAFVRRALADDLEAHRTFLAQIATGAAPRRGRPPGMPTIADGDAMSNEAWEIATSQLAEALRVEEVPPTPRPTKRWPLGLGLGLGLVCAALTIGLLTPEVAPVSPVHAAAEPAIVPPPDADLLTPPPTTPPVAEPPPTKQPARRARRKERTKAPVPAPVAKPVLGRAELTILAEPYATVRLDGELVGSTPKYRVEATAGSHELELIHPATGDIRHRLTLVLKEGEHRRVRAPPM